MLNASHDPNSTLIEAYNGVSLPATNKPSLESVLANKRVEKLLIKVMIAVLSILLIAAVVSIGVKAWLTYGG